MKNVIISEKVREKKLSESPADTTTPVEVAQVSSPVDLAWRYRWAMNNFNMNVAKKLGPTGVKKYWRRVGQIEMELD